MEGSPSDSDSSSPPRPNPIAGYSARPATEDDLAALFAIEARAHAGAAPWTLTHFKEELAKPYSHLLLMTDDETDEEIAGYLVYWLLGDDCQILNVAVDPPHQRKGFARALLRRSLDAALQAGVGKITLDVRKSNAAAIELYQSLRFTIVAVRRSFYSNGEDAYHLALDLKSSDPVDF